MSWRNFRLPKRVRVLVYVSTCVSFGVFVGPLAHALVGHDFQDSIERLTRMDSLIPPWAKGELLEHGGNDIASPPY